MEIMEIMEFREILKIQEITRAFLKLDMIYRKLFKDGLTSIFPHSAFRMGISQVCKVFRVEVFPLSKRIFRDFELVNKHSIKLNNAVVSILQFVA